MAKQNNTKVVTGIVRLSYANIWDPKAPVSGGDPRYSCSLIIPKSDTETVDAINRAIDCAIQEGIGKFGGKIPNKTALKLPLRDGDLEREDDAYKGCWFINANSKTAPQVVDRHVQPIIDRSEIYSGVYARVSLSLYAFSVNGNKGVACGLGNIQKIRDGEPLGGHSNPLSTGYTRFLNPAGWRCTMVWSAYLGLPLSLAGAGAVLGLDKQKMSEGKDLIRYFCQPCAPSKTNGGRTHNLPSHDRQKWETFKAYNIRDVETEISIQHRLQNYPVPEQVWDQYHLDQEINDRGIALDMTLVENAIQMDTRSRNELTSAIQHLTALENPNSVQQMKAWLADNGLETETLGKKAVAELLQDCPPELREVLLLRQQLAKSSVKKYIAMKNAVCADGRARGMFMFYGANRTGRFSGRLIQLQNLPQNKMPDLGMARDLVRTGDFEQVKLLYDDVPDTLSQLIRTAFIPAPGYKFVVSDFAAIEARVIAWLAGEAWRQKVFLEGGDIYCASASAMFHVPVVKHGINGHLRQRGKIAELALGYGGSVGALKAMGALEMGVPEKELKPLVDAWRESNPNIVRLWWDVDRAVTEAVIDKSKTETHGIRFTCTSGMLFITLPSGRRLSYVKPHIGTNQFGGDSITYMGVGSTKKWERLESYGPKFCENIVQAISRDILCYAMQTLRSSRIVAHVHDELIIECPPEVSLQAVSDQMGRTPPWAPGLVLRADGDEMAYYQKA